MFIVKRIRKLIYYVEETEITKSKTVLKPKIVVLAETETLFCKLTFNPMHVAKIVFNMIFRFGFRFVRTFH